jgi:heterodisulfide reductase subunit A
VGGGIAGITAALELNRLGIGAVLVEKSTFLGGHAVNLACKATDECLKCNDCLVEDKLKEASQEARMDVRLGTEIEGIERNGKGFEILLKENPRWIDPEKCTDCGLCYQACHDASCGAIVMAPSHHLHPRYAMDPGNCFSCLEQGRHPCRDVCPEDAIHPDNKEALIRLHVDGLVLATGFKPFDPKEQTRYGYGRLRNMLTAMELEKMLRFQGHVSRPSDGETPGNVAFIQCVGSRDSHIDHNYCSRVCCGYALRMALRCRHDFPDMEITLFYMDIQNFGKDFDRYYSKVKESIRLIRGLPGDFYASKDDLISVSYYDEKHHETVAEDFDLVVLSVGMTPEPSHSFFCNHLTIDSDEHGFLRPPQEGTGVVIAGSAEGPMDVSESISHAKRAALEIAHHLGVV